MYMQNTCSAHGPFFPAHQGDPCPACKTEQYRQQKQTEEALAGFEHWLHQDMFLQVDDLLQTFRIEKFCPAALLAILSITYHAKDKLKHRDTFLARVEVQLRAELGDERTGNLLRTRR